MKYLKLLILLSEGSSNFFKFRIIILENRADLHHLPNLHRAGIAAGMGVYFNQSKWLDGLSPTTGMLTGRLWIQMHHSAMLDT